MSNVGFPNVDNRKLPDLSVQDAGDFKDRTLQNALTNLGSALTALRAFDSDQNGTYEIMPQRVTDILVTTGYELGDADGVLTAFKKLVTRVPIAVPAGGAYVVTLHWYEGDPAVAHTTVGLANGTFTPASFLTAGAIDYANGYISLTFGGGAPSANTKITLDFTLNWQPGMAALVASLASDFVLLRKLVVAE